MAVRTGLLTDRIGGGLRIAAAVFFLLQGLDVWAGQVTLAWDPSASAEVDGYRLYYGQASGDYTDRIDVGRVTRYTLTGLADNTTYYFAVTAYASAEGRESGFSNEASQTIGGAGAAPAAHLLNISTNTLVEVGQEVMAGFIVTGAEAGRFAFSAEDQDGVFDPQLRLTRFPGGELITENDDWRDHPSAGELPAALGREPNADRAAAFVVTLEPGAYLATMSGFNGAAGRGLIGGIEALDNAASAHLLNISTNTLVEVGQEVMAGFIVTGAEAGRFAFSAEDQDGVFDPQLRLTRFPGGELITENDDWRDHPSAGELPAALGREPNADRAAAFVVTLEPGAYLATMSGSHGAAGRGLIGGIQAR